MANFQFTVIDTAQVDTPECQITLSPFEEKLLLPSTDYAIDMLRQRFLFALTDDHFLTRSARVLVQTVLETEMKVLFTKLVTFAPNIADSHVCQRRRYLDIDADMKKFAFLLEPALVALAAHIPESYVRLLRRYLASEYARYRVSATSALICFAVTSAPVT